ncbi:MAG: AmmeMemoRadiSam system radical SAM enzyme [Deltaproteobacteria bacterium]|nr:AmmeMemoRadiSam system radical SAM enzyme [Deltaproteobacteria bacterium]
MSDCHPAVLWEPVEGKPGKVRCDLCAHRCLLGPGQTGLCHVRRNENGALCTLTYGNLISANVDPIEKKPLFHFHPASRSMSIATVGCNFRCSYCQNWSIAQWPKLHPGRPLPGDFLEPGELVGAAEAAGCATIAYTYTEPTIFFEYALDAARIASDRGIRNVFVTNGYMTTEALDLMDGVLHAANVDLKTMDDQVMRRLTGAKVAPVLDMIRLMKEKNIWVEVTTLVVPGLNDSDEHLGRVAEFVAGLDPDIPWHVSRFHPDYEMADVPATPPATLERACRIGEAAGLHYVYTGNLWGDDYESTRCPNCGRVVIERRGFSVGDIRIRDGRCVNCGAEIAGEGLP